jgi:penicillin-binding protein 1A
MVKLIRFLFVCAVVLAIAGCGFAGITIWYFGRDLPDYQQLAHYQPPITTRVHAGDGRLLAEYATERRVFVPIQAIPDRVIDAFLSAEDKNFYSHHGIDPVSIVRAAITDVGGCGRSGVGRRLDDYSAGCQNMLLTNEISIERKIKEILLATRIGRRYRRTVFSSSISTRFISVPALWRSTAARPISTNRLTS